MNVPALAQRRLPFADCSTAELLLVPPSSVFAEDALTQDSLRCIGANQSAELASQLAEFWELAALPWAWTRFAQGTAVAVKDNEGEPHGVAFGQGRVDLSVGATPELSLVQVHFHAPVAFGWGLCRDDFALQVVQNEALQQYIALADELVAKAESEAAGFLVVCTFEGEWDESIQSWKRLIARRFVDEVVVPRLRQEAPQQWLLAA